MTILNELTKKEVWLDYLEYKKQKQSLNKKELAELEEFIRVEGYKKIAISIVNGDYQFSIPKKLLVNKIGTKKKRVVYSFEKIETYVLKLVAHLLYKYDNVFAPNLFSFRKNSGVKSAITALTKSKLPPYAIKIDISNYFNTINVKLLLDTMQDFINDKPLLDFFTKLLSIDKVMYEGSIVPECCGGMAGVPVSPFFANAYLKHIDWYFYNQGIPYARYSDDIIFFADTKDKLISYKEALYSFIEEKGLIINKDKEEIYDNRPWEFLGVSCYDKTVDLSSITINKIKGKIYRKCKALTRWKDQKNVDSEKAIKTTIKIFNNKFYNAHLNGELSWSRWFFPLLTTDKGLKIVDEYFVSHLRTIATGRFTKSNYKQVPYKKLKELGYRSLVNEYYKSKKQSKI